METTPTRPVLVEQVPSEEYEVDLCIPRDLEDLAEGVDGVLSPHGVFLGVAYVVVRGEEDAEAAARSGQRVARPGQSNIPLWKKRMSGTL